MDTINRIDSAGLKQGPWKKFRHDGSAYEFKNYVDGKKTGYYLFYDKDENPTSLGFSDTVKSTRYSFSFLNRNLWRTYYVDSLGNRMLVDYYENQLPKTGGNKIGDNGQVVTYYENGALKSLFTYKNDKKHGPYSTYHMNGLLSESGIVLNERPWTIFNKFDTSGNSIDFGDIIKGNGIEKEYHENGTISRTVEYKNGGYWNTLQILDSLGNELKKGSIKDGSGITFYYYDNGSLKKEVHYLKGIKNGEIKQYHKNGNLKIKGDFLNDLKEGKWERYDSNGEWEGMQEWNRGVPGTIWCR